MTRPAISVVCILLLLRYFWLRSRRIAEFPGRRAVVTGAAGGIGKEVTFALAKRGWKVYACDANEDMLKSAGFPLDAVTLFPLDVRNESHCQALVTRVQSEGKVLDALLNIAGIIQGGPVTGFSWDQRKLIYDVNTFGPMRLCEMFLPMLALAKHGGSVVNFASVVSQVAMPWSGNYSCTKAAIKIYSDCLRREAMANNLPLRVTVVCPGPVRTAMADLLMQKTREWANTNVDNPLQPGCKKNVEYHYSLQDAGWDMNIVALTASDVSDAVLEILQNKSPVSLKMVMGWNFAILYYLLLYLPTPLSDRLSILC